jgi:hypothetical protein
MAEPDPASIAPTPAASSKLRRVIIAPSRDAVSIASKPRLQHQSSIDHLLSVVPRRCPNVESVGVKCGEIVRLD